MTILIVDQFQGPSPYELQQQPMQFKLLCEQLLAAPKPSYGTPAQVLEIDESTYHQPYATTAFREGEDGATVVWKYRWDSSG